MSDFMARITGPGYGQVKLNGEDISDSVKGFEVLANAGDTNRVILHVHVHEFHVDGEAEVSVPPRTEAVLRSLGWTPPEEVNDGRDSGSPEGSSPQG